MASASLPGSYQEDVQTTRTSMFGFTARAPERVGVDALEHFGNRKGGDVAEDVGLRRGGGEHAGEVAAFIEAGRVVLDVLARLVARGVLEVDVRELLGDLHDGVHVAERRREDDLVALLGEVADDALGVGIFRDVLDPGHLDLVAELLFDELAGDVMLGGPAFLVGRADVDEGDLQRLVLGEDGDRGGVERDGGGAGEAELEGSTFLHG